jgi:hypothetical protein
MNIRRFSMATATFCLAIGGVSATTLPAQAAPLSEETHCLLSASGQGMRCASTSAALRTLSPAAITPLVTVFRDRNYSGPAITYWQKPCSAESDFSPPDYRAVIRRPLRQEVSSVLKYTAGHCNWVLVGPNGGTSTEVETSWANLNKLGSGWEDRAVRIRLD